ncbi:uncharacterized protein LOC124807774 isoform X11 [Hydra vulgaris]|uniref:uncharacterized protein LOC124807774 isoform X11 n=2 Tax=Hydra vulgaris TaxID=6087 RepID=UPI0032E9E28D
MNWVIKQILHRHLMQLLCHHLLWLSNQLSLPLITSILFLVLVLVPSTSETVVSSTSTTFRKFKSYFFVHFVCNMCICIYICFCWLEFNNKLALPNGKPQNLLYLFASHKTCCIYLQSCNMVLGGRGAAYTPFHEVNLYTTSYYFYNIPTIFAFQQRNLPVVKKGKVN